MTAAGLNTASARSISLASANRVTSDAEAWASTVADGCGGADAEASGARAGSKRDEEGPVGRRGEEEEGTARADAAREAMALALGRMTGWKKTAQSQCRGQMLRKTVRRGNRNEQRRGAQDARRWSSERSRPWARAGTRSPSTEQARGVPVGMMTAADQRQAR